MVIASQFDSWSDHHQSRVVTAQAGLLYEQAPAALFGALAAAAVLVAALWDQVPRPTLLVWFGFYSLMQLPRHLLVRRYKKVSHRQRDAAPYWKWTFSGLTWLSGLLWGAAGVVLFPEQSVGHQCLLAIFIAGIASAAAISYAPVAACYFPTVLAELLPTSARYLFEDTEVGILIGSAIALYAVVLVVSGRNVHRTMRESLLLRFDKDDLIRELSDEKTRTDNLNDELKRQVCESQGMQRELQKARDTLEARVFERTEALDLANKRLMLEIEERIQAEYECMESQSRFRAVFESAHDLMFIKNTSLRYTHVNPAMVETLCVPADRIVGASDEAIFSSSEATHSRNLDGRALAGDLIEDEHAITAGGVNLTLNWVRFPLRGEHGEICGVCGIGRDVTERRERANVDAQGGKSYQSSIMKEVYANVTMAAETDCIALFLGESGSGKDYWARRLHELSQRSAGPFIAINCAALAPDLVESELFGHEKGAFTGAVRRKRGILELAEGGTLLLNEIGELPLPLQAKILSFLDTDSFMRVGGEKLIAANVRIVAATNRDLTTEVAAGAFRTDLFYRLNVFPIKVPPLRQRVEDIPDLVKELLSSLSARMGLPRAPDVDPLALRAILDYPWPGNVRELRNVLEHAIIIGDRNCIRAINLGGLRDGSAGPTPNHDGQVFSLHFNQRLDMRDSLRTAKEWMIAQALQQAGGKIEQAARILSVSRDSLRHHMKSLGLVHKP